MLSDFDIEREAKGSNRFKPASAKHWLIFFIKKNDRWPKVEEIPTRFTVVRYDRDSWSYTSRQNRLDSLHAAAKEICETDHYAAASDCFFFTTIEHATMFKLKVSELL